MTATTHSTRDGVVIAGGGLAAQRCAETLRRHGYAGPIRMICAESHRPYDRPPLSKGTLTGTHPDAALGYRPSGWYDEHEVELLLDCSAVGASTAERRVLLSGGRSLRYDKLLIATGSRPRTLAPLHGYGNVSVLRTLEDSRTLRDVLATPRRLAVIGAGFIGQEVAATARTLGVEVTMIESAPCPLLGVLGAQMGTWFARLHRDQGVNVITRASVTRVSGNGVVRTLTLSDGTVLETDHVVVGVGVAPDVEWLAGSGVPCERGIPVDDAGRTAVPDVFAAGDAAATFDPIAGRHAPGSHWEAAGRQAARAARAMLGLAPGRSTVSSFWTDQYGIRIQYVGSAATADALTIGGEPERRNFTATFTRAGRPVAALLVDRPRSLPAARALIESERQQ